MAGQQNGAGLALVTGGSRGIGRATCLRLAQDGYAVAVGYTHGADGANETVAAIRAAGGQADAFQADIGDAAAIPPLFEAADARFGPLRLLVANAGILGEERRIDEHTPETLRRLLDVNVLGTMLCAQQAVRRLSTRHGGKGGTIVLLGSVAARLGGLPGLVAYAASKGAIETLVRGLSNEVGSEGIRVVGVAPGVIHTDMTSPDAERSVRSGTPLGRMGEAQEVAEAVAWLASPAASYVAGTMLTVSGGR
ncbi:SDR family oxidoreductase [Sphingomonas abietis]|uniref:SDR family oxidoreductase n=1 Tax=Sphingomonas abietis TaxID=3012344 RepID=A0ABY7NGQ7_9SPHN|nr:SDR family oxidoreductase [Sphingomonas abietis]WBO20708.1 SDR family oxidoreductase [Sphingomonas abietis]